MDSPPEDTVPAKRSITVRDLLTFTFGFGSVMARPGRIGFRNSFAIVVWEAMVRRIRR
jgi:hypothetical protein